MTAVSGCGTREPGPQAVPGDVGEYRLGDLAWVVGIAFFLPVLWMVITAFKPESAAETWPPKFTFSPTLAQFRLVFAGWGPYVTHSVIATVGSTVLVLLLGVPAAYALSIHPVKHWRDGLFFFISTKMLPIVAVDRPAVRHRAQDAPAGQHLAADHLVHRDEPAAGHLADPLVHARGAQRDCSRPPSWTAPGGSGR